MWAESSVSMMPYVTWESWGTKGGMTAGTRRRNVSWNLVVERLR